MGVHAVDIQSCVDFVTPLCVKSPNIGMSPMLSHNVCQNFLSRDMGEGSASLGNCFADKVEGEHVVLLVQLGLELHCTFNHIFIVAKDTGLLVDWNTQTSECGSQVNDLLSTGTSSQHLTAASGNLSSGLLLGEPVQWCLVEEVEDPCASLSSHQVVHQVCIGAVGKSEPFTQWWWSIVRKDLLEGTMQ